MAEAARVQRTVVLGVDLNIGEWHALRGGDVRLKVRHLSPKKEREIRKSLGLPAYEPDGEQLTEAQQTGLALAKLDWILEAWEGVTDLEGQPVPCTLEAKVALVDQDEAMAEALPQLARLTYHLRQGHARRGLGNSPGSSHGAASTPDTTAAPTEASPAEARPAPKTS